MDAATTRPSRQYTQPEQVLYVAFELSSRTWKLGMSVGFGQKARERNVPAGDLVALSEEIRLAKKRFGLQDRCQAIVPTSPLLGEAHPGPLPQQLAPGGEVGGRGGARRFKNKDATRGATVAASPRDR